MLQHFLDLIFRDLVESALKDLTVEGIDSTASLKYAIHQINRIINSHTLSNNLYCQQQKRCLGCISQILLQDQQCGSRAVHLAGCHYQNYKTLGENSSQPEKPV